MTKVSFAVIGDCHLNISSPASRVDDWADTCLSKLASIRTELVRRNINTAIQLGDFWHSNNQPPWLINRVCAELSKWREAGISLYAIVGNHELAHERIENLDRNPLQILFTTGLVKHLRHLHLDFVDVFGYDYPQAINSAPQCSRYSVAVAHRLYESSLTDFSLTSKNLTHLGYDLYILGHDHQRYDLVKVGKSYLLRPGSLMRTSAHAYHLSRKPSFEVATVEESANSYHLSVDTVVLPHAPSNSVFTNQSFAVEPEQADMAEISARIDQLIASMDENKSDQYIYSILDQLGLNPATKDLIESYLLNAQYYRTELTNELVS